jgi:DMSO reductase anchor subunit
MMEKHCVFCEIATDLKKIVSHVLGTIDGLWLVIGFIDHLHVVTVNNHYTITDFYITNHLTPSLLHLLPLVFTQ